MTTKTKAQAQTQRKQTRHTYVDDLRAAQSRREQLALVNDKYPGTKFDRFFAACEEAVKLKEQQDFLDRMAEDPNEKPPKRLEPSELLKARLVFIGQEAVKLFASVMSGPEGTGSAYAFARALEEWKNHVPRPDRIRRAVLGAAGLNGATGMPNESTSMKSVEVRLKGKATGDEKRGIRQKAKALKIKIQEEIS